MFVIASVAVVRASVMCSVGVSAVEIAIAIVIVLVMVFL